MFQTNQFSILANSVIHLFEIPLVAHLCAISGTLFLQRRALSTGLAKPDIQHLHAFVSDLKAP